MPYTMDNLPDHVMKMSDNKKKQWMHVFNTSMESGDSEETAFKKANGMASKSAKKDLIMSLYQVDKRQLMPENVGYNSMGMSGGKGCGSCNWFVPVDDACVLVCGDIVATGLCKMHMAPPGPMEMMPMPVKIVKDSSGAKNADNADDSGNATQTGFNFETLPEEARKGLLARLKDWLFPHQSPESASASAPVPPVQGGYESKIVPLVLVRTKDGQLRFILNVSNNFKDKHKEVLAESSHKEYVSWVDSTQQYPEAWLWHTKGSKWGQVDWVEYADGFLVASGLVDPGKEELALKLAEQELEVSHGFIGLFTKDGIVVKYRSYEFSVLPKGDAANPYNTDYNLLEAAKEANAMAFSEKKRKWLAETAGMSEEQISAWETANKEFAEKLKAAGVVFKEAEESAAKEDSVALDEVRSVTKAVGDLAGVVAGLTEQVKAIAVQVGDLSKTQDEKISEVFAAKIAAGGFTASRAKETEVPAAQVSTKEGEFLSWFPAQVFGGGKVNGSA